jgi:Virulence activator alpha C-term
VSSVWGANFTGSGVSVSAVGGAVQEPVRIRHHAVGEPEPVQHREPVEPVPIAIGQLRAHREKLREYQELEQALSGTELAGPLTTLRAGIGLEREWIRYWAGLAGEDDDRA